MSDSGDESEGWEIEKQAIRLKKYRRELFHSSRGYGSLKVHNKIKLRLADSAKRLIGYYRKKFDEMRTNASTNKEDLEEVGMKLFELYDELFQLGTVQGVNDWKTGTYDINSCLFDFYERSCSNLPLSVELFPDHDKLCKKLQVVASSIMDLDLPLMRSDWGTRIVRLKQPWIQFYEGQLNGLPVSFETLKDAESIAEKLKNLYSEMTKLEPDGVNNWPAKNVRLEEHLIEFLSKLLAKLPVCFESYSDAEVICGKLKSFFLEGIELYPRFAWTYEAKIFELEKQLARRKRSNGIRMLGV